MFIRLIRLKVTKEDSAKVIAVVNTYAKGLIRATSYDSYNKIEFSCTIFNVNRCRHDLNLAIALGIGIKIED